MSDLMPPIWAIGLMSGTSMDGIDAALVKTDGERITEFGPSTTTPYSENFQKRLRALLGRDPQVARDARAVEATLTRFHARAVKSLLAAADMRPTDVAVIGFHGHTVLHRPDLGVTRQIGDAGGLAAATGIDVVGGFRLADVDAGGEGAPFAPVYHRALAADLERPLAVLNLGGVGNVTYIDETGGLLAFDTGPGNAMIDDWVRLKTGSRYDVDGALAAQGHPIERVFKDIMDNAYFSRPAPKSLDREDFKINPKWSMGAADGAATLAAVTVESVFQGQELLPKRPKRWLVTGGGRHNPVLMSGLANRLRAQVDPVEAVGWQGDAIEAQAFGFLAVRSLKGLPLSYPNTTGVPSPQTGGTWFAAPDKAA